MGQRSTAPPPKPGRLSGVAGVSHDVAVIGQAWVLIRRHWLMSVLLACGLALRVCTQLAYQPALLYIDSFRYLAQLATWDPRGLSPIGYDLFVLGPVLTVSGLAGVAAVQHMTGMAMAVVMYALLLRWGAWRWLAAAATAPVLLDAYQVQIEHNIMSDAPFQVLLVALVSVLAWHRRPGPRAAAVAGLLAAALIMFRLVSVTLAAPIVVYLLMVAGPWTQPRAALRRGAVLAGSMLLALAAGVFVYAAYFHAWSGQWAISSSHISALYGRMAAVADCRTATLTPAQRQLCPAEPLAQRRGADYYAHNPASPVRQLVEAGRPIPEVSELASSFNRSVLLAQPGDVAAAVTVDFLKGFRWHKVDAPGDVPISRWQFQTSYPEFSDDPYNPDPDALRRTLSAAGYDRPTVNQPLAQFLRTYQLTIGYTPGPALAAALLCGIVGIAAHRNRRPELRAPCLLTSGLVVTLLITAALIEFSWRYQLPALVLIPLAGVLGITAWRPATRDR